MALCAAAGLLASAGCDRGPPPARVPPPPRVTTAPPPEEAAAANVSEERAIAIVSERLRRAEGAVPVDCLRVYVETVSPDDFELAVRERHDQDCPGEAGEEPLVDRWRVHRASGEVERYDAGLDRWAPAPPG